MGQYYTPTILKKNWKLSKNPVRFAIKTWDFENGLKLMEHSYIGNSVMKTMEHLLANDYKGYNVVWCGDYADEVSTNLVNIDLYSYSCDFFESKEYKEKLATIPKDIPYYRYLVNYTKKEYCTLPEFKPNTWVMHPLSLLTASGNGRGGGDYPFEDERIGRWAFDRIGVTNDMNELKGFKEIDGKFKCDF